MKLSTHAHLVLKFRVNAVIPNGVHKENFTITDSTFNTVPDIYRSTKQSTIYGHAID